MHPNSRWLLHCEEQRSDHAIDVVDLPHILGPEVVRIAGIECIRLEERAPAGPTGVDLEHPRTTAAIPPRLGVESSGGRGLISPSQTNGVRNLAASRVGTRPQSRQPAEECVYTSRQQGRTIAPSRH